jgi:DNA-binding MarR family transcriptional regulator
MDRDPDRDPSWRAHENALEALRQVQFHIQSLRFVDQTSPPATGTLADVAASEVRRRKAQLQVLGSKLAANPAWDMLLDLFLAQGRGEAISVTSLCYASHVPPTTALRWIGVLIDEGLLCRRHDPRDKRRSHLSLTDVGLDRITRSLAALC